MKKNQMNDGNIYFHNFRFNPAYRGLYIKGELLRLRKKQAEVLTLLCERYPNPVSYEEFLSEVWGGTYVTSQSISQVIRSLRLCLGDDSKSIIITISKLGYQLNAQPHNIALLMKNHDCECLNKANKNRH